MQTRNKDHVSDFLSFWNQNIQLVLLDVWSNMQSDYKFKDTIPDDLILNILSYTDATDLISFQATCKKYRKLSGANDLWKKLCRRRWQTLPMYSTGRRIGSSSEIETDTRCLTWRERYLWVERDFRRTEISREELEGLEWHFNFLPWAGESSDGTGTRSSAIFYQGQVYLLKYLWMYPILNFDVIEINTHDDSTQEDDVIRNAEFLSGLEVVLGEPLLQAMIAADASCPRTSAKQFVQISTFPPHYVARTSTGGWILWNENVVFFSTGVTRGVNLPGQLEMHLRMFRF